MCLFLAYTREFAIEINSCELYQERQFQRIHWKRVFYVREENKNNRVYLHRIIKAVSLTDFILVNFFLEKSKKFPKRRKTHRTVSPKNPILLLINNDSVPEGLKETCLLYFLFTTEWRFKVPFRVLLLHDDMHLHRSSIVFSSIFVAAFGIYKTHRLKSCTS